MAKRISIINFKGGVGKTTLSFNLAAGLARYHNSRVLLVDVDHQSSLSIVSLTASVWSECVDNHRTVNEIFETFVGQGHFMPGADIIERRAVKNSRNYNSLDVLPASLELDDIEIDLTASHQGNAIHSEWNKRTLICQWLEHANIDDEYDYIIFDCPPATKIVSQNAIAASHGYILPVVPEAVMERGAPHLVNMIRHGIDERLNALSRMGSHRSMYVRQTQLIALAITRIRTHGPAASGYTNDHTLHLASLQRRWGPNLVQPYIEEGVGVSECLASGRPVYDHPQDQNVGGRNLDSMYRQLTDVLKARIDRL
ncbi:AAA family ATPase [Gluconobacter japonicus]|uniref:AAA family ATPase n=1 Tax=Gluconobacter japonicus TaxID=376620 RepID=A0A9Q2FK81_GLUJA|nr:AAA family ATPase [Gluconobacter japonicus]